MQDMIREYEVNEAELTARILRLEWERDRMQPNTTGWIEMNSRIYGLRIMRDETRRDLLEMRDRQEVKTCAGKRKVS